MRDVCWFAGAVTVIALFVLITSLGTGWGTVHQIDAVVAVAAGGIFVGCLTALFSSPQADEAGVELESTAREAAALEAMAGGSVAG